MWWFFLSQFVFDKCEKGFGLRKDEHLEPVQSCLSEFNCHHRDSVYGNNRAHVSNVDVQGRFLSFFFGFGKSVGLEEDEPASFQCLYMTKFDQLKSNVEVSHLQVHQCSAANLKYQSSCSFGMLYASCKDRAWIKRPLPFLYKASFLS